jgi:L-threonylcarbamoyladenylate synthase
VETLSTSGNLDEAAAQLFQAMRRLDGQGFDYLLARPIPSHGLGEAICDRLRRAAEGKVF